MSDHKGGGEAVLVVQSAAPQWVAHPCNWSVTWATEKDHTALIIKYQDEGHDILMHSDDGDGKLEPCCVRYDCSHCDGLNLFLAS